MKTYKDKFVPVISLILGLWFVGCALVSYDFQILGNWELSFWSNFCVGVLLMAGGINSLKNKKMLPSFLYFDAMLLLVLVFVFVIAFASQMNFSDGFQFLHLINPIAMFLFWLIGNDHTSDHVIPTTLTGLIAPLIYVIIVELFKSGYYPPLSVRENGLMNVLILVVLFLAVMFLLGIVSLRVNQWLHRNFFRKA